MKNNKKIYIIIIIVIVLIIIWVILYNKYKKVETVSMDKPIKLDENKDYNEEIKKFNENMIKRWIKPTLEIKK